MLQPSVIALVKYISRFLHGPKSYTGAIVPISTSAPGHRSRDQLISAPQDLISKCRH
jgi:hypothetical protein